MARTTLRTSNTTRLLATAEEDRSYDHTSSPDGTLETTILMHSRMGIRIEFNVHRSELSLWLSPQAGKSVDYRDRNFSCRDDHTSIFDRMTFPELGAKGFIGCDYDPFHSVLEYRGQRLHLVSLLDVPVIALWAESEEVVDFKSDKQDSILRRTPAVFGVRHPDRGKVFDFFARLGRGRGSMLHQPEIDEGRSTYARAILAKGQLLAIGGELSKERVESVVARVAATSPKRLLAANEQRIARALSPGDIVIRDNPEMQKLYDTNKRHLLSAQDASGAIRAALKYVYYLIWSTDGSVTATSMMQTGWHEFHERWLEFLLANPTSQQSPPKGRFYGQLVNGSITKREEFGCLCAVWAAFMHYGLTGDARFVSGKYLKVLEDAVDWLDRYCWDAKVGGLGTFYIGGGSEDPFYGSNDFGWDAAVGSPMSRVTYAPRHQGKLIRRVYEFSMNLNHFNMYLMLASVTSGARSRAYRIKARRARAFLEKLLERNAKAFYLLEGKGLVAVPYDKGARESGLLAVQSSSPAFFMPDFARLYQNRQRAFVPLTEKSVKGKMPCGVYGRLAGLDTEFVDEDAVFQSIAATLSYHVRPSKFMPMAYTMVETLGLEGGEFHDIRPQAFSAGPFQAAVTNLAVRTMPFGIALRSSRHVKELRHFAYLDGTLHVRYRGTGAIAKVRIGGKNVEHTLQIPDDLVRSGSVVVDVELARNPPRQPTLVYSTIRLERVRARANAVVYTVTAYCQNVLVFRDVSAEVVVRDARGSAVKSEVTENGRHRFVEFEGSGRFSVEVAIRTSSGRR